MPFSNLASENSIKVVNSADWHYPNSEELSMNPDFINTFPEHCMANTLGARFVSETNPENPLIIDIRTPAEYEAGFIEGAININFYDLEGKLLLSSVAIENSDSIYDSSDYLKPYELNKLKTKDRFVEGVELSDGKRLQSSYSYLYNKENELIGFLRLHYIQDNSVQDQNLNEFLKRLGYVYLLMFIIAINVAYLLSS